MDKIKKEMENEKQNFLIHLQRFEQLYPQYKTNPTDDISNIYNSIQENIDKGFEKLYILKNELLSNSDSLANSMMIKDDYINNAKEIHSERNRELTTIKNQGNASLPRMKSIKKQLKNEVIYTIIQAGFFIGNGYLLYKILRS
jgi:hypothetical protein